MSSNPNMDDDDEILAAARAGFVDESAQMLRQFEDALLVMESDPSDAENLNAAFRAAHTIKGTAGLFGCDAVVAFTHEVETVMEAMRSNELSVSEPCVALLLKSRDQMEKLLAEVDSTHRDPAVAQASIDLGAALRALRQGAAGPAAGPSEDADLLSEAATVSPGSADGSKVGAALWHVSLRFLPDALRNGLDPLAFLRYLGTLGEVRNQLTLVDPVPALDSLDAETCHLGFEIRLHADTSREQIEQVFEFAVDDCTLQILGPGSSTDDVDALIEKVARDVEEELLLRDWFDAAGPISAPRRSVQAQQDANLTPSAKAGTHGDIDTLTPVNAAPAQPTRTTDLVAVATPVAPERREPSGNRRGNAPGRRNADQSFIRVRADKLDHLIDLIGELVIASSGAQLVAQTESSPRFTEAAQRISDLVESARDGALGLRMVPIGETFTRFQRVVRDVSKLLNKEVELQITGGDTELDKSMVETLADPLMHLVRNSLDHGLEPTEDRVANGKHPQGRLALHAYHESGSVVIEVSDDGRGLNRDRILNKAIARGLVSPDQVLSDNEVNQLICLPGFSTAEQVTDISGRGVGMDVVKRNIEALRGQIYIASEEGVGTTMQIRLPLTLAIIDGFLASVAGVSYVLPLEIVAECIETPPTFDLQGTAAAGCFDLRGEVVPYLDMRRCFGHSDARPARQSLIVVRTSGNRLGLLVDRLLGEHQTVIKPLSGIFQNVEGIAGSTILGSGEVALILDVAALERRQIAQRHPPGGGHAAPPRPAAVLADH